MFFVFDTLMSLREKAPLPPPAEGEADKLSVHGLVNLVFLLAILVGLPGVFILGKDCLNQGV